MKKLIERWGSTNDVGSVRVAEIMELTNGLAVSRFGEFEARIDFRGLSFAGRPEDSSPTHMEFRDLQIKNADFSGALFLSVHFHSCIFENCKFSQCSMTDVFFASGCKMTDCSFDGATVTALACIEIDFLRCSFSKTKWKGRYNMFSRVNMIGCVFEGSFRTFDFGGAVMKDVKLIGSFYDVTFHGWHSAKSPHPRLARPGDSSSWLETSIELVPNKMERVDFFEANLRMTNLRDFCYLDRVILPPITTHCVFRKTDEMLATVREQLELAFSKQEQKKIRETLYRHFFVIGSQHTTTPHAICNIEDCMEGVSPEDGRKLYEIVVSATERLGTRVSGIHK